MGRKEPKPPRLHVHNRRGQQRPWTDENGTKWVEIHCTCGVVVDDVRA